MIICKKCKTQLEDGTRFCYICGTEVTETKQCPDCGKTVSREASFCPNCGKPFIPDKAVPAQGPAAEPERSAAPENKAIAAPAAGNTGMPVQGNMVTPASGTTPQGPVSMPSVTPQGPIFMPGAMPLEPLPMPVQADGTKTAKAKSKGKILPKVLIAAAVILVIIAAAILIPGLLKKNKSVNAALYLKDGEINYSSLTDINPKEITDQLSGSSSDTSDFGYYIGYSITFSSDGKRIFYPDRFHDNSEGMTIYYQNLNSKTLEGEKIDSEISQYRTNDAGTKIFYIKGEENDLYVSNLKEKEKLDSNVSAFYASSSKAAR